MDMSFARISFPVIYRFLDVSAISERFETSRPPQVKHFFVQNYNGAVRERLTYLNF